MPSRCVARWCIRCCRSQCIHTQHLRIIYGRQQANVNTQIYMRIYVCTIQWASHGMISLRSPLAFISCPSFQMSCCFRFPMRFPAISKPMSSTYQTRLVCNKFQNLQFKFENTWNMNEIVYSLPDCYCSIQAYCVAYFLRCFQSKCQCYYSIFVSIVIN